ncbi:hypothetical protein A2U01_0054813, partial [Trifolium medium]|nr:hypothetical protein [Trifolium medium]
RDQELMVLREEVPKENEQQLGRLGISKEGEPEDRSKDEVTKVESKSSHIGKKAF